MNRQEGVVVVGGGIWGLSTAYHLARAGWTDVEVLERNDAPFDETTSQAAGLVGQIRATPLMRRAIRHAIDLFEDFENETGHDPGFHQVGSLLLALTPERMASFEEHVEHANSSGVEARFVDGAQISGLAPHLDISQIEGGYFVPEDGYLDPRQCARAFCGAAEDLDVRIRTSTAVTGLSVRDERVVGVETDRGFVEAERVVDAGGPRGAAEVGAMVGVEVPVMAVRHQVVSFPVFPEGEEHPFPLVFNVGKGYYWRPEEEGVLLGMSNPVDEADESGRYQIGFDWDYYEETRPDWEDAFPALEGLPVSKAWAASIDYTPDHLPIIDEAMEGFYVLAAGGHGMMWGPALGEKLAELIVEGEVEGLPKDEIELGRFGRERDRSGPRDTIALPFPEK